MKKAIGTFEFVVAVFGLFLLYTMLSAASPKGALMKGVIKQGRFYVKDLNGGYRPAQKRGNKLYYDGKYVGEIVNKTSF